LNIKAFYEKNNLINPLIDEVVPKSLPVVQQAPIDPAFFL
jgi:hypothetical protein